MDHDLIIAVAYLAYMLSISVNLMYFKYVFSPCSAWMKREYHDYGQPTDDWEAYSIFSVLTLATMVILMRVYGRVPSEQEALIR